ncbi:MAG: HD domain-containing protein [Planctomycetes bacterium]|nr:HD domain-containing protein [Planctomycetota bacterium]
MPSIQVRDPVHKFVELEGKEIRLLQTRLVQRLRGIHQLAMANLVYPGALHTRFDHSLGVCHVAQLMARQLHLDDDETRLVRCAALLHDLGHGPFSHVSESVLSRYADVSALPPGQTTHEIHELITRHLIENDQEIVDILGREVCGQIGELLSPDGYGPQVLHSIVSGPLDADKQDYLLRDSRFCGVPYGTFDLDQFHRSLVTGGPQDDKMLRIASGGVHAVEQYVLAKYYLTYNVYCHKVRLITDQMLIRAAILGIEEDSLEDLRRLFTFSNEPGFLEEYASWDDSRFMHEFGAKSERSSLCAELLNRLSRRELLKKVYDQEVDTATFSDPQTRDKLLGLSKRDNDAKRRELEREVAKLIEEVSDSEINPHFVIVHAFDIRSVRAGSAGDEGAINIETQDGPVAFEEKSVLFHSINENYAKARVHVYAPASWATTTARHRLRENLRDPITEVIIGTCT